MQDHSSFDARHNMGSTPENRFCRLFVHCAGGGRIIFSLTVHSPYIMSSHSCRTVASQVSLLIMQRAVS